MVYSVLNDDDTTSKTFKDWYEDQLMETMEDKKDQ
jgi:hypothetical protein